MHIGIDARLWNETGVGRYIRNLVEELAVVDTQNTYTLFVRSTDYDHIFVDNVRIKKVRADYHWHSFQEQIFFPLLLHKHQVDLMHFPYFSYPFLYTKPFVLTIHDLILNHFATGKASTQSAVVYVLKRLGYTFLMSWGVRHAKHLITVSHATKKEILDEYKVSEKHITVTYEGVDTHIVQKDKKNPMTSPYFLFVGNVYPHKNTTYLLDGFALFSKQHKDYVLVFVGKEDFFYQRLKKQVHERELEKHVVFAHTVSDEELASYYTFAKALVIPSLMEGFGLPAIEAMNYQCFVIASKIPSLEEVCQDAVWYVDPKNPQALADMLTNVIHLSAKEKKEYEHRMVLLLKRFSWTSMAKQTQTVYENSIRI